MPRKDSSKPDPFGDLKDETPEAPEETPVKAAEEAPKQPPAVNESVVTVEEVAAAEENRPPVKLAFDPSFAVDDRVSEVVVSVAAEQETFKVDGTPVEVEAAKADLLLQSPAVKEAK